VKTPEEKIMRWLHPVVFAVWTGFLIYLLASRRYVAFLRPEFGILLATAYFIALGFMLTAIIRPQTAQMNLPALLRAMVLLVPVLYSMAMPDAMLGNQAFKKRFIGTGSDIVSRQVPSTPSSREPDNHSDFVPAPEENVIAGQAKPRELTILDIYLKPEFFKGQQVTVTGMILRDEQLKDHFGGRDTALFRFLINCCAADALPLAIVLDSDQANAFEKNQWVQVEGLFDLLQSGGKPVPIILKPLIKPIEAPAVPYLF